MLKNNNIRLSKEDELNYGRQVQLGLKARNRLENEPTLTDEEIIELNKQVSEGEFAHDQLFEAHISFANKLASNLHYKAGVNYSLDDMAQDAYMGLSQAINTYDPEKNCQLSTHAYYNTTKVLSVNLNKNRSVRLPENKMGDYLHITKAEAEFIQANNGMPDPEEMIQYIMEKTKLSKENIFLIKDTIKGAVSLNTPLGEDGGELGDLIKDINSPTYVVENKTLAEILGQLSQEDQDLIAYQTGVGIPSVPEKEFTEKTGMTHDDIDKAANRIIRKIKKQIKGGQLV